MFLLSFKTIRRLVAVVCWPLVTLHAQDISQSESVHDIAGEDVDFAFAALIHHVQAVTTGEVSVECRLSIHGHSERTSTHHFVFDRELSQIRYDKVSPERSSQYLRNTTEQVVHFPGDRARNVDVFPLGHEIKATSALPCDIFDIGFHYWVDMVPNDRLSSLELATAWQATPVTEVTVLPEDLLQLTWVLRPTLDDLLNHPTLGEYFAEAKAKGTPVPLNESIKTVRLDSTRDFVPVFLSVEVVDPATPDAHSHSECETEWTKVNGVYVPIRCKMTQTLDGKSTDTSTLNLTWSSVNKQLPTGSFTLDAMDLPKDTKIVSHVLDELVVTGVVGATQLPQPLSRSSSGRGVLLGMNLAIFAVVAALIWWYRRSTTH